MPQHYLQEYVLIDLYIWYGINQGGKDPCLTLRLVWIFCGKKGLFFIKY